MRTQTIVAPSDSSSEGALYFSPRGLYDFQANHIASAYLGLVSGQQPEWMFAWDTGLGKSHAAMQLSALAFEDGEADLVVLVCERNKLKEWKADFEEFTKLSCRIHHGPNRKKKLAKEGMPDVLITTYETGRADFVQMSKNDRGRRIFEDSTMLMGIHSRKPLVFFDEADKLSNRTSSTYRTYEYVLKSLRKHFKKLPVFMMTATSIRKDYENAFNQLRLLRPQAMPLIKEFDTYFVRGRDIYGKARYWDHRTEEFAAICQPLMLTKSKTDPDVIEQFPVMTEEALWVDLEGNQKKLYDLVAEMDGVGGQLQTLRQIAAHPASLIHSAKHGESKLSKSLVQELGEDWLRSAGSAKTDALVSYLDPIVRHQGDKAVVFSFFGPSVLPLLSEALYARGIPVYEFRDPEQLQAFKSASGGAVLLSSDAGARGVNIPEASYLVEYDMAVTYGLRTQRLNRISRIGAGGPTATVRSMLARDSVEIALMFSMLRGNAQSDELLGHGVDGSEFMTAAMRRAMLTEKME